MTTSLRATALASHPFLSAIPAESLRRLAVHAHSQTFAKGQEIFREGQLAGEFFLIRQGSVRLDAEISDRGRVEVETLNADAALGWSWLFEPYRWHFDARALTLVRATAFDGACLRRKCESDPGLGYALMGRFAQVLIERMQWMRLRLLDLYGDGAAR